MQNKPNPFAMTANQRPRDIGDELFDRIIARHEPLPSFTGGYTYGDEHNDGYVDPVNPDSGQYAYPPDQGPPQGGLRELTPEQIQTLMQTIRGPEAGTAMGAPMDAPPLGPFTLDRMK